MKLIKDDYELPTTDEIYAGSKIKLLVMSPERFTIMEMFREYHLINIIIR